MTVSCMVSDLPRPIRVEGLPTLMLPRGREILLPQGTVITPGQHVTVDGGNRYQVVNESEPRTNAAGVTVTVVQITGGVLVPNATVVFKRGTVSTAPVPVYIRPAYLDVRLQVYGTEFQYQMFYPSGLTIGGQPLQEGDFVLWSGFVGGRVTLHHPAHFVGPLPFDTALLTEIT